MVMTDPLADMFTRIRNAAKAKHAKVDIPSSKFKLSIAKILKDEGFIKNYRVIDDKKQGTLRIYLKYDALGRSLIMGIKRISRPSLRKYVRKDEIPKVLKGIGISILSTSHGVITDNQAKELNLGGELICSVW
jgi:small subunit ribosomal protein S8